MHTCVQSVVQQNYLLKLDDLLLVNFFHLLFFLSQFTAQLITLITAVVNLLWNTTERLIPLGSERS